MILNRAKDYNKDELRERERAKNKYRELSEEEKNVKRQYHRNRYHSMSDDKKQKLKNIKEITARLKNRHNYFICILF